MKKRLAKHKSIALRILVLLFIFSMLLIKIFIPDATQCLKDYNLIIINIDALRVDHLGCYGYFRNTSPFIDSLAEKGILFEYVLSNSSYTRESVSVLMSGYLPSHSGSFGWHAASSHEIVNLGQLYQEAGYKTGFFSNTTVLKGSSFTKGFQEYQHLSKKGSESRLGSKLSARAIEFAKDCGKEKFMMHLHYLHPHGPIILPKNCTSDLRTEYLQILSKFTVMSA